MNKLIVLLFAVVMFSCHKGEKASKIAEGIIEYSISYSSDSVSSVPLQFLPKKMILQFNKDFASYQINLMDVFCITNITNLNKKTHTATFKMFNSKFRYEGRKGEYPIFFAPNTQFAILTQQDTLSLAGRNCYKAIVSDVNKLRNFQVYYTNDFEVSHPNTNTPYSDIPGVLMNFEIDLGRLRLTVIAKKVIVTPVDASVFQIDESYKPINQDKMRKIIDDLVR